MVGRDRLVGRSLQPPLGLCRGGSTASPIMLNTIPTQNGEGEGEFLTRSADLTEPCGAGPVRVGAEKEATNEIERKKEGRS